jgi:hypothetical protein
MFSRAMLIFRDWEFALSKRTNRIKQANLDDALLKEPKHLVYLEPDTSGIAHWATSIG